MLLILLLGFVKIQLNLNGTKQLVENDNIYGIVIGANGVNSRHVSLEETTINNLRTGAIKWEQGAFADFSNVYIYHCSGYGIYCTANYDDNNHGIFTNTEIIECNIGLLVADDNGATTTRSSRHHVFHNFKIFGCQKGFEIQSNSNFGSFMLEENKYIENGITIQNPGELTSSSYGNRIEIINTVHVWNQIKDYGRGNLIEGFSSYNFYKFKNIQADSLKIYKDGLIGRLVFTQENTNEIVNKITDSTNYTTVRHSKGSAEQRTDIFEDRVQIGSFKFSTAKTGVINCNGTISANNYKIFTVMSSETWASNSVIPTIWATLFLPSGFDNSLNIHLEYNLINDVLILKVINDSTSSIDLTNAKIRWTCINHY